MGFFKVSLILISHLNAFFAAITFYVFQSSNFIFKYLLIVIAKSTEIREQILYDFYTFKTIKFLHLILSL